MVQIITAQQQEVMTKQGDSSRYFVHSSVRNMYMCCNYVVVV